MGAAELNQLSLSRATCHSLLSLIFNVGGLLAGFLVATSLGLFSGKPWIVAVYPGVLSMRGVIGGIFSGRLSTGLHLGTVKSSVLGREARNLHVLWGSVSVAAMGGGVLLGALALPFGITFWGIDLLDSLTIIGTILATMGLSLLVMSPITIAVSLASFRRGLDPDVIVYPIISTIADILVTSCYFLVLSMCFSLGGIGQFAVFMICLVFSSTVFAVSYTNRGDAEFTRTIKEAVLTMLIVAVIVNITGSVLSKVGNVAGSRQGVYIVYPALTSMVGDVGAIVGSTATTKLALGYLDSSVGSMRNHANQVLGAWLGSLVICSLLGVIASVHSILSGHAGEVLGFVGLLLATNIFTVPLMIIIVLAVAVLTFQRGLDPDNFVIPVESSIADAVTTVALLLVLSLVS